MKNYKLPFFLFLILISVSGVWAVECGSVPTDGCTVSINTTFDGLPHQLNGSNGFYGLAINNVSGIYLDCNGSILYGNNSRIGLQYTGGNKSNVLIKNCNFHSFVNSINIVGSNWTFLNNTFLNASSYALMTYGSGMQIINNTFLGNNHAIYVSYNNKFYGDNLIIYNNTIDNQINKNSLYISNITNISLRNNNIDADGNGISSTCIRINYCTNGNIENNLCRSNPFVITNSTGIYVKNNTIINQYGYPSLQVNTYSDNITLIKNTINVSDTGITVYNSTNILTLNNTIYNMTTNYDGYGLGINYDRNSSGEISYNNIQYVPHAGILIRSSNNILLNGNYVDLVPENIKITISGYDNYEYPYAYGCAEIYKLYLGDSNERYGDDLNKISKYGCNNLTFVNNTYGPNVRLPLFIQGGRNITNDFYNTYYKSFKYPDNLADKNEYYISNLFDELKLKSNYNGQISDIARMGYSDCSGTCVVWYYSNYTIKRNYTYLKNTNQTANFNLSTFNLSSSLILLSNNSIVGSSDISQNNGDFNISLSPNMSVYVYTNVSALPLLVNYNLSYNTQEQNNYSQTTTNIQNSVVGTVINFFSLTPVIGTILGVVILILAIVTLVIYIKSFNNSESPDSIYP